MSVQCVGGMEAIDYFESLPVPEGKETLREYALNRIKYEIAKGIGVKPKIRHAIKSWHHDEHVCGRCGSGIGDAWFEYCPNCGTKILKNEYTERKVKEHQIDIDEWMKLEGG